MGLAEKVLCFAEKQTRILLHNCIFFTKGKSTTDKVVVSQKELCARRSEGSGSGALGGKYGTLRAQGEFSVPAGGFVRGLGASQPRP